MTQQSYNQFCPVAMASEILGNRWAIILLRELCAGSTRFNDLRRGVPRMSPALLSKRLRELEQHRVIRRTLVRRSPDTYEYFLTESGRELKDVVMAIGIWGQRWVEAKPSLENSDPDLLMWDMRRNIVVGKMPQRRITIQFIFTVQQKEPRNFWMICDPDNGADLCSVEPGFDVDLFVHCSVETMTAIWMGLDTVQNAVEQDKLLLVGDGQVSTGMQHWLGLSPFAAYKKYVT